MGRKRSKEFCSCLLLQKSQSFNEKYQSIHLLLFWWNIRPSEITLCITVWGWKLFLPICFKKRKKIRQEAGEILVQYHSRPVHVTVRGRGKLRQKRGSGRWFSWGGWNERQSSTWKMWFCWEGWLAHGHSTVGSSWLTYEIPCARGREEITRGVFSRTAVLRKA